VAGPDLAELWQQILAGLELPSTRMLLSQQAQLVRLDERRAVVRVSGTWMAMVQSRLPLLEKAGASALGGSRQLQLESGGDPPTGERASAVVPLEPVIPAPTIAADSPATPAPAVPAPPPAAAPPAPSPPAAAPPAPSPAAVASPPPAAPSPLEERARRLADFFNGEVIDGLEDEVA
jgi:DNA polymerase-3 subunit gamma/tau